MNYRVDVIIIGDSKNGHELLDKLATGNPKINIAFISQAFKSTTTHDYINVKYFRGEVEYLSYRHRMFNCYLKNKDIIFSTHVIVASGVSYEPLMLNNEVVPNVYNNADDIPKIAKNQPALVIYKQASDAKLALEVAKKYKQVYLCTKELDITKDITKATAEKISKVENLVVLPNASVQKAISENGALQKVELDNYSRINCSAVFVKTDFKPATEFIPKKLVQKDEYGYLVVSDKAESTLVPKFFAAGNCAKKYTKAMDQQIIETILNDF